MLEEATEISRYEISRYAEALVRDVKNQVEEAMNKLQGQSDLLLIARIAESILQFLVEAHEEQHKGTTFAAACSKGCNYCCHIEVNVSIPELLILTKYLQQTLTAPELVAFMQRLKESAKISANMTTKERAINKVACPVLSESGHCLGYEFRPLACRGYISVDADYCKAAFGTADEPIPIRSDSYEAAGAVQAGVELGLMDLAYPWPRVELIAALLIAFEDPKAGKKYYRAETVFKSVERTGPKA
jgi:Fe-S-cluster containining protein